jgi:hypothetical protein
METKNPVKTMLENDIKHVTIITGTTPEVPNPKPISIVGNIDAPSNFLEGRFKDFKECRNHCLVSKTKGVIKLVLNEQDVLNRYEVTGKIEVSDKFQSLGINADKHYTPEALANRFKLLRQIFVSNLEHAQICAILRNLKAKINADLEKNDDRRGNVGLYFKQTVESNMPEAIKLRVPLIEGAEPTEIEVNVILETNGNQDVICSLESVEASELLETQFKQVIEAEMTKLKKFVTLIEY